MLSLLSKNASPATRKHTAPTVKVTRSRTSTPTAAAAPGTHQRANIQPTWRVLELVAMNTPRPIPARKNSNNSMPKRVKTKFTLL